MAEAFIVSLPRILNHSVFVDEIRNALLLESNVQRPIVDPTPYVDDTDWL